MGRHHPAAYFAESILAPNAVLVDGPGWVGPDGRSVMPSYADSLSVTQLLDLVAYLTSLGGSPGHTRSSSATKVAGDYTVQLTLGAAVGGHGHGAASAGHGHGAMDTGTSGHVMVVVADRATGEPVPYLPVSATVQAGGKDVLRVPLAPMLDARGFHYGADLTLPGGADRIAVSIGPTTVRVMGPLAGRFATPTTAVFEVPRKE